MALKKVISEFYGKKTIYESNESPLIKIKEELLEYFVPQDIYEVKFNIPSIPGGKIETCESLIAGENNLGKLSDPTIIFYYLEGSNEDDLNQIRESITKRGLEKLSLEEAKKLFFPLLQDK